jgi:hypothetical protein
MGCAGDPARPGSGRLAIFSGAGMKAMPLAAALCLAASQAWARDLPDPRITPGAVNPGVTQENIAATICVKGWTRTVRPPAHYTNRLKKEQIREYGYEDRNPKDYEEDHLIPLDLGGNPADPRNLWPEPRNSEWGADRKDELEFAMYRAVCHGDITLEEGRRAFATDWIAAYRKYHDLLRRYRHGHTR